MIQIDMPMPEACDVCPFNYDFCWCKAFGDHDNWEKYSDDWNKNVCERTTRPEYCPLKEQEAVEPYVTGRGETFETAETWWYACGNCHEALDVNDKYCRHCGRQVKWE